MVISELITYLTGKISHDYYWGVLFDFTSNLSKLPTIDFLYGGYWFQMTAEDYALDIGNGIGAFCIEDYGTETDGIFGDAFMMNYYTVFDNANMKFGFAPLVNAHTIKPPGVKGTTP